MTSSMPVLAQHGDLPRLGLGLGCGRDRNVHETQPVAGRHRAEVGMIGNDEGEVGSVVPARDRRIRSWKQ
jgi:hypothetical protein